MKPSKEFVLSLNDDVKLQIIRDFEYFEKEGYINESTLRNESYKLAEYVGASWGTEWMNILAFECYCYFANRYIEQTFKRSK